jgi:aryl-alcohol dehydrogenase-like predicted oxidoreductase
MLIFRTGPDPGFKFLAATATLAGPSDDEDESHLWRSFSGSFKVNLSTRVQNDSWTALMKYRVLGKTRLKVSEVGFGAWAIGGNAYGNSYGPTDDNQSLAAIQRALELGCNFFDTADVYGHGHSEELLGQALKGHRSDVIIATKVGGDFYHGASSMNFNSDYLEFALGKSCARLGSDYIDLYQLHNPPTQLVRDGRVFKTLEKLKVSGKIRHYGISIHDPQEGLLAMRNGEIGAVQVVFNILRQEAKNQLFREATKNNVGVIAREPLANGFLAGKLKPESTFPEGDIRHNFPPDYISQLTGAVDQLRFLESKNRTLAQAALRYVLDHKDISTVIPGAKTPEQADEDLASSESPSLTGEELLRIKFLRDQGFA